MHRWRYSRVECSGGGIAVSNAAVHLNGDGSDGDVSGDGQFGNDRINGGGDVSLWVCSEWRLLSRLEIMIWLSR